MCRDRQYRALHHKGNQVIALETSKRLLDFILSTTEGPENMFHSGFLLREILSSSDSNSNSMPEKIPIKAAFEPYRTTFPVRPPNLAKMLSDDELTLMPIEKGRHIVAECPVVGIKLERNLPVGNDSKYLWVIGAEDISCGLEYGEFGMALPRKRLSHTNLTAGKDAHSAGEAWFLEDSRILFNGGSSRYTPRSEAELNEVAVALRKSGYQCTHMGWDDDNDLPARTLRGDLVWQ